MLQEEIARREKTLLERSDLREGEREDLQSKLEEAKGELAVAKTQRAGLQERANGLDARIQQISAEARGHAGKMRDPRRLMDLRVKDSRKVAELEHDRKLLETERDDLSTQIGDKQKWSDRPEPEYQDETRAARPMTGDAKTDEQLEKLDSEIDQAHKTMRDKLRALTADPKRPLPRCKILLDEYDTAVRTSDNAYRKREAIIQAGQPSGPLVWPSSGPPWLPGNVTRPPPVSPPGEQVPSARSTPLEAAPAHVDPNTQSRAAPTGITPRRPS
jgi:predicted  nucleic acid-binding Zn-ribbon protein